MPEQRITYHAGPDQKVIPGQFPHTNGRDAHIRPKDSHQHPDGKQRPGLDSKPVKPGCGCGGIGGTGQAALGEANQAGCHDGRRIKPARGIVIAVRVTVQYSYTESRIRVGEEFKVARFDFPFKVFTAFLSMTKKSKVGQAKPTSLHQHTVMQAAY